MHTVISRPPPQKGTHHTRAGAQPANQHPFLRSEQGAPVHTAHTHVLRGDAEGTKWRCVRTMPTDLRKPFPESSAVGLSAVHTWGLMTGRTNMRQHPTRMEKRGEHASIWKSNKQTSTHEKPSHVLVAAPYPPQSQDAFSTANFCAQRSIGKGGRGDDAATLVVASWHPIHRQYQNGQQVFANRMQSQPTHAAATTLLC